MHEDKFIELKDATGALAVIAPELGGWLLRYARPTAKHGLVDALHLVVGERLVLAALHAGAHGGIRHGNGARTHRLAGFAATAAAGKVFDSTHGFRLLIWVLYPPVRCGDSLAYLFPGSVSFFHH